MSISSVNFGAAADFQSKIRQPQTFKRPDSTIASTGINNENEENSSIGKKVAIGLGTAAVVAGALGAGKHYGVFKKGENEKLNTVKEYLGKAGQKVLDAKDWVVNKAKALKEKVWSSNKDASAAADDAAANAANGENAANGVSAQ